MFWDLFTKACKIFYNNNNNNKINNTIHVFWPYLGCAELDRAELDRAEVSALGWRSNLSRPILHLSSQDMYSTRLTRLGLSSLHARRIKSDLCSCYKITHSLTVLDPLIYFSPRTFNVTRGHLFMLCKPPVRLNSSKFSFFSRVIDHWNTLPSNTVSAGTFSSFKARLKLIRLPDKFTIPSPN